MLHYCNLKKRQCAHLGGYLCHQAQPPNLLPLAGKVVMFSGVKVRTDEKSREKEELGESISSL